jgi:hypothetical protein
VIAAWLRSFFSYADVSTSTLRATHAALALSGPFARQREAIAIEITVRDWAEAIEDRLDRGVCVWTERGGVS